MAVIMPQKAHSLTVAIHYLALFCHLNLLQLKKLLFTKSHISQTTTEEPERNKHLKMREKHSKEGREIERERGTSLKKSERN